MMSDANVRHNGSGNSKDTNLTIHDGIMDISSKFTKFIHILDIVEKPRNLALHFQWF